MFLPSEFLEEDERKHSYHVIRMVDMLEGTLQAVKTQHDGHSAPSLACGQLHNSSCLAHGKAFPLPT